MKKPKKKFFRHLTKTKLRSLIIICIVLLLAAFVFLPKIKFISPQINSQFSPCSSIKSVEYIDNHIRISFNKKISDADNYSSLFGYQTTAFEMPLTFSSESFKFVMSTDTEIFYDIDNSKYLIILLYFQIKHH